jgi:hypothetical protein
MDSVFHDINGTKRTTFTQVRYFKIRKAVVSNTEATTRIHSLVPLLIVRLAHEMPFRRNFKFGFQKNNKIFFLYKNTFQIDIASKNLYYSRHTHCTTSSLAISVT